MSAQPPGVALPCQLSCGRPKGRRRVIVDGGALRRSLYEASFPISSDLRCCNTSWATLVGSARPGRCAPFPWGLATARFAHRPFHLKRSRHFALGLLRLLGGVVRWAQHGLRTSGWPCLLVHSVNVWGSGGARQAKEVLHPASDAGSMCFLVASSVLGYTRLSPSSWGDWSLRLPASGSPAIEDRRAYRYPAAASARGASREATPNIMTYRP